MEKVEAAKKLYFQGATQKEIAELLHVQPKTVGSWAKKEEWENKRSQFSMMKETSEEKVWKLITYQLKVIELISQKMEEQLDESLEVSALKKLLIERGDIDALQKLFTTIKGKELEWSHIVNVIKELTEYLESSNFVLAKEFTSLANEFLNEKRKDL